MRKQIAAANWKMNLGLDEAEELLTQLSVAEIDLKADQEVIIGVPYPYLLLAKNILSDKNGFYVSAENCHEEDFGAFTGEVSAAMLASCKVEYVILGHSERRYYFDESNKFLQNKVSRATANNVNPIFCCGEPLDIRDGNRQEEFVKLQILEGLFHLEPRDMKKVVIAYEPIWAIGTGKTATAEQAQEMHLFIRTTIAEKYGDDVANEVPILYGGSVKPSNAKEIFSQKDVDGGLIGGASLKADQFIEIIQSLKSAE